MKLSSACRRSFCIVVPPFLAARIFAANVTITSIAAQTMGRVELTGTHGFAVGKPAAYVAIQGFTFTHAAGHDTIASGANHVRFTRNTFHCSGEGAEIDVAGDDAEVDHNEFRDKALVGNMVSVTGRDGQVAAGSKLTCHDRPDDCVVSFNTLIDNKINFQMGGRTKGRGATNTTFANNVIVGGGPAAVICKTAPCLGAVWIGNLIWKATGAGDLPADSYVTADPLLSPDANGVFHLTAGSPAIHAATGKYPVVIFDRDGQPRVDRKSKGAEPGTVARQSGGELRRGVNQLLSGFCS